MTHRLSHMHPLAAILLWTALTVLAGLLLGRNAWAMLVVGAAGLVFVKRCADNHSR